MELLREAIRRVFGAADDVTLAPVSEADANRSWYVELPGVRCIAKLPERHGGLTIESAMEYELLRLTAGALIAPRPIARDAPTEILFVDELGRATELSAEQARDEALLPRVAESLHALHALPAPADLRRFDAVAFARVYCEKSLGSAARRSEALVVETNQLAAQCNRLLQGESLCHNDLHTGNLLVDEQLWFVDFEYAVRASPIVDIASYAALNELDIDAAMMLAEMCLGTARTPSKSDIEAAIRIQKILGELWEIARSDNNEGS
jgi:thiamine kinase-like enzyme